MITIYKDGVMVPNGAFSISESDNYGFINAMWAAGKY